MAEALLHMVKMAVGIDSVDHLAQVQRERWGDRGYRHFTRARPRRAEEIAGRGSLFWVIRGVISVRQPILGFEEAEDLEGRVRCAILLDRAHHRVWPQRMRPFQGWRYFSAAVAPLDSGGADGVAPDDPPVELLASLRELGLL